MNWEKARQDYDKKQVLKWMRTFPDQCIEAAYFASTFKPKKKKIEKIVACGMGGSGIGASILRNMLKDELKIPFEVFNSYRLPAYVDQKTLVFCISFSGNTEETLACYRQAKKKKAYVVSIATGGKLSKMAKRDLILMPNGAPQPRMGLAYVMLPVLTVLEKLKLVKRKSHELNQAVFLLKKEQRQLEETGRELAFKIRGKLPIIYAAEEMQAVAGRFGKDLNENSKQLALTNFLPEQNHNEINAWLGLERKNCEIILLRHESEYKKISKRFKVLKKLMGKHFNVTEVELKGKTLISSTFYALQLSAMASYYLALLNKQDPEKIPLIAALKRELAK